MVEKKNTRTYRHLPRPAIFAHRGSSAHAPENTLAAFRLAVQHQADAVELDAKLCADGEVVVIHDLTVDRTTNGSGRVNELTLLEVKQLDAGSKFNPVFWVEKVPTLAEVFEIVGGQIVINVELTNYASPMDELPDRVCALVKRYGLESSVMLSSFNLLALIRARYLLPRIQLAVLAFSGDGPKIWASKIVRFGPRLAFHPNMADTTPELIQAAHRARCRVHAYIANDPIKMKQLFAMGVDGIFSYNPLLARKVLAEIDQHNL